MTSTLKKGNPYEFMDFNIFHMFPSTEVILCHGQTDKSLADGKPFKSALASFILFFFFFFNFFRATPAAYGGSQARSGIRTAAAGLWVRVRVTPDPSALYGNTGSLNH